MKRKKIYSMLVLGMAMSLVAAVPVSAAGSLSPDTSQPPIVSDPVDNGDGTQTVVTTKPTVTTPEGNKVTEKTEVTTNEAGETVGTVETVTTEKTDGSTVEAVKKTDASGKVSETTTTTVDGNVTEVTLDNVVTAPEDLNAIVNAPDTIVSEGEAKVDLAVPDALPEGEDEEALKAASSTLFAGLDLVNKTVSINLPGFKVMVNAVETTVQSVAVDAAKEMAKQVWGEGSESSVELLASANIDIPEHDGSTPVRVNIPLKNGPDENLEYFVMHYKNGVWDRLPAHISKDGVVVAVFDSFSPVFVVTAPKSAIPEAPADTDNDGDDGNDDGADSSDSGNSGSNSGASGSNNAVNPGKAGNAPAAPTTPVNPAVSPKTGE